MPHLKLTAHNPANQDKLRFEIKSNKEWPMYGYILDWYTARDVEKWIPENVQGRHWHFLVHWYRDAGIGLYDFVVFFQREEELIFKLKFPIFAVYTFPE